MDKNEFLEYVPIRKCEFEAVNGIVTVLYDRPQKSLIDKLFFSGISKKPSKIDLDEIGSFIWTIIDGSKNVEEIINDSKDKFSDKIEPAEERVIKFLRQMAGTNLIELYKKR